MADSQTQRDRAVENAQQYVYARDAGHLEYVKKANRCLDFVDSYGDKQWEETIARRLRAEGKPVLTIGKIMPTMAIIMGEQLQNEVDMSFRATSSGSPETAEAYDKVWLHTAHNNEYSFLKAEVFDFGTITSRAFFDVRMSFHDNIKGDIAITIEDGRNVVLDPDGTTYNPNTWNQVFITKWHTPEDIGVKYNEEAGKMLRDRPHSAFAYGGSDFLDHPVGTFGQQLGFQNLLIGPDGAKLRRYVRVIERQHVEHKKVPHFVEPTTGEVRPIPSNWPRERIQLAIEQAGVLVVDLMGKLMRWTVSADDLLLHDKLMPYEHFTLVPYFPHFIAGRTIGLVENLIGSQEGLNKARSQELHIINSIANSGWVVDEDSLVNMEIEELERRGAETGLVIVKRRGSEVDKITPNQVPTGLDRISFKFDQDMEDLSNVGPGMRSTAREDVSGKALRQQEVRGTIGQSRPLMNLSRTDFLVGTRVLSLAQRYYTDERVLDIVNPDPRRTAETVVINQVEPDGTITNDLTVGEYNLVVVPVPAREQHEDTVFDQSVAMRELGINISDATIVANSRLPNRNQVLEELQPTEQQQRLGEIELETKEEELNAIKAQNMDTRAAAVDKVARAKRAAQEALPSDSPEMAKLALERERMERELALERYKIDQELELEREKMRRESRLKELEMRQSDDRAA